MELPTFLDYPIVAIGDLHGQLGDLQRLIGRLEAIPEWPDCAVIVLGDFLDRGPDVRGAIDFVLGLLRRPAGGSAVMGNHDLALVRAAQLDGGAYSPYWSEHYRDCYDHQRTFESYLGRRAASWEEDLAALGDAVPGHHRDFLTSLPWVVEAPGHLFLHNGLSDELQASAEEQVEALKSKRWDRSRLRPIPGTKTDALWKDEYPVWLGADKGLSESPRPYPGKLLVTGHARVRQPEVSATRVRLDTSGGFGALTACLLRSAAAAPVFFPSR